jgi:hypothetical protein
MLCTCPHPLLIIYEIADAETAMPNPVRRMYSTNGHFAPFLGYPNTARLRELV